MTRTASHRLQICATILLGSFVLSAYDCDSNPTAPLTVQGCNTTYDSNWPSSFGSLSLAKSTYCPLEITGVVDVPYAATATLNPSAFIYGAYEGMVTTWKGYNVSFVADPVWSTGSDGNYMVSISGDYYAATSGFDSNNQGYDDVRNGFESNATRNWTYATTRIPYSFGSPSNDIMTPDQPPPDRAYTASATTHNVWMVDPVSWSWYVDGTFLGTTTAPQISIRAGDAYQSQAVEVTASDNYGHSASGTTNVQMSCGTNNCVQ